VDVGEPTFTIEDWTRALPVPSAQKIAGDLLNENTLLIYSYKITQNSAYVKRLGPVLRTLSDLVLCRSVSKL
jgi:hypothetical protein